MEQLAGTWHPAHCRLVTLRPPKSAGKLPGNLRMGTNHSGRANCVLVTVCVVPLILFSGKDIVLKGPEEKISFTGQYFFSTTNNGGGLRNELFPITLGLTAQPMLSS